MDYQITCKNKARKLFLLALMPSILAQLGLTHRPGNVYVVVEKTTEEGETHTAGAGCYVVLLNTGRSVVDTAVTLCHEMVHVKQFLTGKLNCKKNMGSTWCGKRYSRSTSYMDQPWELQAFREQEVIFRRAFDTL